MSQYFAVVVAVPERHSVRVHSHGDGVSW